MNSGNQSNEPHPSTPTELKRKPFTLSRWILLVALTLVVASITYAAWTIASRDCLDAKSRNCRGASQGQDGKSKVNPRQYEWD